MGVDANCDYLCNESWLVLISFLIAALLIVLTARLHGEVWAAVKANERLGKRNPFDVTASSASNFTVVGAILTPLLSLGGGTADPYPFASWHSYQLLGVLFGALVVLAPFAYRARVRSFLLAIGLTLAALSGQAMTAMALSYAIGRAAAREGSPVLVAYVVIVVVGLGALLISLYVWQLIPNTVRGTAEWRRRKEAREKDHPGGPAPDEPPPVSLPT